MTQKICMSKSYFLSVVQALMGHVAIIAAILMGHVPIAHSAVTCSDSLNRNDTQDNARRTEKLESTFKRMQDIGWIAKSDSIEWCDVTNHGSTFARDFTRFDTRAGHKVSVNMRKNTASLMKAGGFETLCLDMDLGKIWRSTTIGSC